MLSVQNLSFRTPEGRTILNDIDLEFKNGRIAVLTGPNGGGKTTLAKMIAGVETPTAGRILLDGEDITALDPTERAKAGISYAFQQPVRFKGITVRDLLNIAAGTVLTDAQITDALGKVGLAAADYVDRAVGTHLSGGEIKRIEIATVLLRKSKVALFDEPEAGIDLWSFNNLIRVFEMLRDESGCTTVIISHQERILSIADEIVMIQDGRVGLQGAASHIYQSLICKNDGCDNCVRDARE